MVPDEYLFRVVDALDAIAAETGKTMPQVAINWVPLRPSVASVIIGARTGEQLRQNLGAVGWELTPEQIARLDAASETPPPTPPGTGGSMPSGIRRRSDERERPAGAVPGRSCGID